MDVHDAPSGSSRAAGWVRAALERLGFECSDSPSLVSAHGAPIVAVRPGHAFAVAWASIIPYRRRDLRGALADAALRLQRAGEITDLAPLVAIVLDKATPAATGEVSRYMREYAPAVSWLVVDSHDQARWSLAGETGEADWGAKERPVLATRSSPVGARRDPFTPAFQWLLKVLLLAGLDRRYWGGPTDRPVTITQLSRASGVSQPQVSVFVKQQQEAGYLRRGRDGFTFVDIRRMLDAWSISVEHKSGVRRPVTFLYPAADNEAAIKELLAKLRGAQGIGRHAVGLHRACHELGLGRSNVRSVRLYVEKPVEVVEPLLDLVPADAGVAALELAQPRSRHSVFGGAVSVGGTMVTDVLQSYLDVMQSPARGAEQTEHIFDQVLEPWFRSRGWL